MYSTLRYLQTGSTSGRYHYGDTGATSSGAENNYLYDSSSTYNDYRVFDTTNNTWHNPITNDYEIINNISYSPTYNTYNVTSTTNNITYNSYAASEESPDSETEDLPSGASSEDGSTQGSEPSASLMSDEPFEVIIVDDLTDVSSYTVWDKPFNDYSPTEAFTFLLFVFAVISGMVKFITWAWL